MTFIRRSAVALSFLAVAACTPKGDDMGNLPPQVTPPAKPAPILVQQPPPPPSFPAVQQPPQPDKPQYPKVVQPPIPPPPVFPKVNTNVPVPPSPTQAKHHEDHNLFGGTPVPMDILVVYDTSRSMCADHKLVHKNIEKFVDSFVKNRMIAFHIGVVPVWDSDRYGNAPRAWKNGELRPVRVDGRRSSQRFLTPETPNLSQALADTIDLGIEDLTSNPSTTGPETEEIFSPILAAFSPEMLNGPNKGFRRANAHLAVLILTDTEDRTPGTGQGDLMPPIQVVDTLNGLIDKSKGQTLTVMAALARYNETVNFINGDQSAGQVVFNNQLNALSKCDENQKVTVDPDIGSRTYCGPPGQPQDCTLASPIRDYSRQGHHGEEIPGTIHGPRRIIELVARTAGIGFDLLGHQDFGAEMARMGSTLIKKAIRFQVTPNFLPDTRQPISVQVNGRTIPNDDVNGWSWDSGSQAIRLNEGLQLGALDRMIVTLDYTGFDYVKGK